MAPFGLDFSTVTFEGLLYSKPEWETQICLALCHSVLWYLLLNWILPPLITRFIRSMKTKDQFLLMNKRTFKSMMMWDMGEDQEFILSQVAMFEGVIVQHGVGGALTVPSVLGLGALLPPGVASAMARHGGLCESGWEIEDTLVRIGQVLFGGEVGLAKNPLPLRIMLAMHHSAAQCLVIPLNVLYPENAYYHEGIFLLQAAAVIAFLMQQWGFTLDIKTAAGLVQMRFSVGFSWLVIMWSRVVRYGFVWYKLMSLFKTDGSVAFRLCLPPVVFMSLFNLAIIGDCTAKLAKFFSMSLDEHDHHELEHAAMQCLNSPRHCRPPASFGITKAHAEWAKVKGAVKMAAIMHHKGA